MPVIINSTLVRIMLKKNSTIFSTYCNKQKQILHTEKWGGHCTSFVAILRSLRSITNEQQCKKPDHFGKYRRKAWQSNPYHAITNWHLALSVKRTWYVYRMYWSWWKGMSWDEATSCSEEIMPVLLSIFELCLAEGIS